MSARFMLVLVTLLCWSCTEQKPAATDNTAPGSKSAGANSQKPACCEEIAPAGELPDMSIYQLQSDWKSQEGKTIRLAHFHGRPIVLAMMFTWCEYACPRTMADLKAIEAQLPPESRDQVRFLLVSFDSEKDKPAVLKAFAKKNGLDLRRWTLLHGADGDVRELAAVLGVKYKRSESVGFSHSNLISVLGRQGRVLHQQKGIGAAPQATIETIAQALD